MPVAGGLGGGRWGVKGQKELPEYATMNMINHIHCAQSLELQTTKIFALRHFVKW